MTICGACIQKSLEAEGTAVEVPGRMKSSLGRGGEKAWVQCDISSGEHREKAGRYRDLKGKASCWAVDFPHVVTHPACLHITLTQALEYLPLICTHCLQEIKTRKLSELREAGVPEKYRAELEKYKAGHHQA